MSRRPLLAGNWKMHLSLGEAVALARALASSCGHCTDREVMIAPAFTALAAVTEAVRGSGLCVGAQNVAWEREGAFTGEVAPPMLTDLGVDMAIVGHSERRQIFGEDDAMINRRLLGALAAGLTPVLCIGETLEEREAERTFAVLEAQLRGGLNGVDAAQADRVVLGPGGPGHRPRLPARGRLGRLDRRARDRSRHRHHRRGERPPAGPHRRGPRPPGRELCRHGPRPRRGGRHGRPR